jgi:membrane fusion protein (multidrug efflux system)
MKIDKEFFKLKAQRLKVKTLELLPKIMAKIIELKSKINKESIIAFLKSVRRVMTPRVIVGLIIVIALAQVVLVKYKIKEKIFRPEPTKKEKLKMKEAEAPQEPILVKVYKTQKKDFDDTLPLLGTVKGFNEINLKFETNGVIDSFNFKEGEKVEEGEIIATVNQKDALLKLKYNEIEIDKIQKLFDMGAVSQAKLEQTKLELESAKRELDKTYLYAPLSGVLGTKDGEVGEFVTSNDKVATLINDKEVYVDLGVVERDIGKVRVGQKGKVMVDTYPDTEFGGVIDSVSPVVEGRSRTQTAKIKVKNPKGQLLPGMFARALVAVYSAKGMIVIPNTAVDKEEQGYVTYVVKKAEVPPKEEAKEKAKKEKGKKKKEKAKEEEALKAIEEQGIAAARPIEADYRSSDYFVVKTGLEEGELVVVETQEKLKDGNRVIITETQEAVF